jgi:regulator of sirC expression with transglutaminase-like and TPR domain
MPGNLDLAVPTPLQYFAALVADDATLPLTEAAVAVGQDDDPTLDVQAVLAQIDALGDRLRRRLPADASPLTRMRLLNGYFFHELGFAGNVNDYHDRRNSFLHEVLRTRRGIPITLAILYLDLAQQLGLQARGISFPGHFLVKLALPRGQVVLDPFSGQSLSREELEDRLAPFRQGFGVPGDDEVPLGLYLQAAPPRDIVARLLRNLKEIHRRLGDRARLLAVMNRIVTLLPHAWDEQRDRALVLAELGQLPEAIQALQQVLAHRPEAEDQPRLRQQLQAWQARLATAQPGGPLLGWRRGDPGGWP